MPIPFFALTAPVMGFSSIFYTEAWHGYEFAEFTLPWLVFWLGVIFIIFAHFLIKHAKKNNKT